MCTINYRQYLMSHGKMPRGYGQWAFFFDGEADINSAFWHTGKFSEALRFAVAYARTKGHQEITIGS